MVSIMFPSPNCREVLIRTYQGHVIYVVFQIQFPNVLVKEALGMLFYYNESTHYDKLKRVCTFLFFQTTYSRPPFSL